MKIAKINDDGISYAVKNLRKEIDTTDPETGAVTFKEIIIPVGWAEISEKMAEKLVYDKEGLPSNDVPLSVSNFDPLGEIKAAKDVPELIAAFVKFYEGT